MLELQGEGDSRLSSTPSVLWTTEQNEVISAGVEKRLIVDAGPGTGKTATACARIAWLINSGGLEASEIWLVSFTRTAVRELRDRIASYLIDPGTISSLRIATIDTHAWAINSGFDATASLSGSFDDNIQSVIELIKNHEGVFEYLGSVRHLIVDEAQDVVGLRCELLLELIHALPQMSGVTVFSDEAQSIYGFAEESSTGSVEGSLPERINEYMPDFKCFELTEIHRTNDPILLDIFHRGRALVRDRSCTGAFRLGGVKDLVSLINHESVGLYREDIRKLPEGRDDTFLLFRRRGEVLDASGYLSPLPHRLRMSGLPISIHSWIAVLFWDWTQPEMDKECFEKLWRERLPLNGSEDSGKAWSTLVQAFGRSEGRISVTRMIVRLASASPPYEFTTPEFGFKGPVIGTIHGAKGREADEVRLYIAPHSVDGTEDEKLGEEARILFVGATRAKSTLRVGQAASKAISRRLNSSGRAYTPYPFARGKKCARAAVELGRIKDIDAAGLVGISLFDTQAEALAAQAQVLGLYGDMTVAQAKSSNSTTGWRFRLVKDGTDDTICFLGTGFTRDLLDVAKKVNELVHLGKLRGPSVLNHLKIFGVRTMVLAPDDPAREFLHSPWRDSGIIAVPMVVGYPFAFFR